MVRLEGQRLAEHRLRARRVAGRLDREPRIAVRGRRRRQPRRLARRSERLPRPPELQQHARAVGVRRRVPGIGLDRPPVGRLRLLGPTERLQPEPQVVVCGDDPRLRLHRPAQQRHRLLEALLRKPDDAEHVQRPRVTRLVAQDTRIEARRLSQRTSLVQRNRFAKPVLHMLLQVLRVRRRRLRQDPRSVTRPRAARQSPCLPLPALAPLRRHGARRQPTGPGAPPQSPPAGVGGRIPARGADGLGGFGLWPPRHLWRATRREGRGSAPRPALGGNPGRAPCDRRK